MSIIAFSLRAEIVRPARIGLRSELDSIRKALAAARAESAALKRRVGELQRSLRQWARTAHMPSASPLPAEHAARADKFQFRASGRLLDERRSTVSRISGAFPRIGRRYLEQPPQSAESLAQLSALPAGAADRLREYLHGDYLILYTVATLGQLVHLLSIRHHRELSFQFYRLWAGPAGSPEG